MRNAMVTGLAWLTVVGHLAAGIASKRQGSVLPYVVVLNLVVAVCVVAYWMQRWYSYLFQGITYYLTDQAMPLFFIGVIVVSVLGLMGRNTGSWPHWVIFGVDAAVSVAAALFFSTFRITKLF